jgi:hypothetical protein
MKQPMNRGTIIALLIHALVIFTILCIAFSPLVSVAIAGSIANANGCQLDEGSVHPCLVNGKDMGETLYTMGVLGWLMLATIPLGLMVVALYILIVLGYYLIRWIMRKRTQRAVL